MESANTDLVFNVAQLQKEPVGSTRKLELSASLLSLGDQHGLDGEAELDALDVTGLAKATRLSRDLLGFFGLERGGTGDRPKEDLSSSKTLCCRPVSQWSFGTILWPRLAGMLRAQSASSGPLFWRRVFVAPVCLCAVAALHVYRVSACCQTPWKGGGFGMFSTVKSEESRFLRCWRMDAEGKSGALHSIAIPRFLAKEELRVRGAPSPERLARLAGLLAESEQSPVVIEVWQFRFDAGSGKLVAEKRGEATGTPEVSRGKP